MLQTFIKLDLDKEQDSRPHRKFHSSQFYKWVFKYAGYIVCLCLSPSLAKLAPNIILKIKS